MEYGIEPLSNQDLMLLSAYLDGQLTEAERQQLEKRLAKDTSLQTELASLQDVVHLVNSLPRLKAPRDFRLDPVIYGQQRTSSTQPAKITRLNLWRLSSIAGVAASFILVIGVLLIVNPFGTNDSENSPTNLNEVAQVTQAKIDTVGSAASDTTTLREDETAIANLPSETVEMRQTVSQQDLRLTITAEYAHAFATDIPTPIWDDALGRDTDIFETGDSANADNSNTAAGAYPESVSGGGGDGSGFAPSPPITLEPSAVALPAVAESPVQNYSNDNSADTSASDNDDTNQDSAGEEASEGENNMNEPLGSAAEEDGLNSDDMAADDPPADETQQEKFWEAPLADGLFTVGTIGLIVSLFSLILNFLLD